MLFAHVPLWTVYPEWGWGTDDSAQALDLLKRFGSVTVLNGHIHQIMQKVEGHVAFHTAMSTAFPQPAPGTAPAPGPMTVDAAKLRSVLGITDVTFVPGRSTLAVADATLSGEPPAFDALTHDAMQRRDSSRRTVTLAPDEIGIDNFRFTPPLLTVAAGTRVTWVNMDDVPASHRERAVPVPAVAGAGHRSQVPGRPAAARDVRLLLLPAPADGRPDRGAASRQPGGSSQQRQ